LGFIRDQMMEGIEPENSVPFHRQGTMLQKTSDSIMIYGRALHG
jgi:hypothetical protein